MDGTADMSDAYIKALALGAPAYPWPLSTAPYTGGVLQVSRPGEETAHCGIDAYCPHEHHASFAVSKSFPVFSERPLDTPLSQEGG